MKDKGMKDKKYKVWYSETNTHYIFIKAKDEEQAEKKAEDILNNGEGLKAFTLDDGNSIMEDVQEVR